MQPNKQCTGREQRHEQRKALQPTSVIIHRHLNSSTWQTAPQHSFKSKGMATPKDESGRQGPWTFITRDLEDRTGPARPCLPLCRLPAPLVVGESRRPIPTAASVAAPDLGPLAWPASSLRRSPHGHAGSRHTAAQRLRRTNGITNALSAFVLDKS